VRAILEKQDKSGELLVGKRDSAKRRNTQKKKLRKYKKTPTPSRLANSGGNTCTNDTKRRKGRK